MRGEDTDPDRISVTREGSPPHARGRHANPLRVHERRGITPACAGKTLLRLLCEKTLYGSPPHARGRLREVEKSRFAQWITPACAGKTPTGRARSCSRTDHPRMRGEDAHVLFAVVGPPRITPACAGKTSTTPSTPSRAWDHPRMRGEDPSDFDVASFVAGSPPHARGRPNTREACFAIGRITPACAGKTAWPPNISYQKTDHPRMRGED